MNVADRYVVRCAMTSVIIDRPGISKRCDVCDRQFLDENKIFPHEWTQKGIETFDIEQFVSTDQADYIQEKLHEHLQRSQFEDHHRSLGRWIFNRYPTCPYCKGGYVG